MISEIWKGYRNTEDEHQFLLGLPARVDPFRLNQNPRAYKEYLEIVSKSEGILRKVGMILHAATHPLEIFDETMMTRVVIMQGAQERVREYERRNNSQN